MLRLLFNNRAANCKCLKLIRLPACTRLSISGDERKRRASSGKAKKKKRKEKREGGVGVGLREAERACKHLFKYLNPPTTLLPPEKKNVYCVKMMCNLHLSSAPRSRVLPRLASLAQIGELARRLLQTLYFPYKLSYYA